MKTKMRSYKEFPENIKNMVWYIYPKKKQVVVSGFKYFDLKELKKIDIDTRLSFPHEILVAINEAG